MISGEEDYYQYSNLFKEADKALEQAYAPFSKLKVGAALLTKSGKVFRGSNIEGSSFETTICAERVALFKALSEGVRDFEAMAIVNNSGKTFLPCGACRQVLSDFMPQGKIIVKSTCNKIESFTVEQLLPFAFRRNL